MNAQAIDSKLTHRISDNYPTSECYTIEELAEEIGVTRSRARQVLKMLLDGRKIQNLQKKDGVRIMFPEPMVKQIKEQYLGGNIVKLRKHKVNQSSNIAKTELLIEVPVYDTQMRDVLISRYKTIDGIRKYLTDCMFNAYKPVLGEMKKLEEEFEQRKKALLSNVG